MRSNKEECENGGSGSNGANRKDCSINVSDQVNYVVVIHSAACVRLEWCMRVTSETSAADQATLSGKGCFVVQQENQRNNDVWNI